jgi:hypothetical protein
MRRLFAWSGLCLWIAATGTHAEKITVPDPRIDGQPIDICSGPPGLNDCGAIGPIAAAVMFCKSIGKSHFLHSETKRVPGNAMHWNGSTWVVAPANAVFSNITCAP